MHYWQFAKSHYLEDGKPAVTLESIRMALRPLRQLYGSTPAADFGPKSLKAVRQHLIDAGLSRGVINKRCGQIKRAFKWAVAWSRPASIMGSKPSPALPSADLRPAKPSPYGPCPTSMSPSYCPLSASSRLEIDPVSIPVADLSAEDVAKVVRRCLDLAHELEPVLAVKAEEENNASDADAVGEATSPGLERLRTLGLIHLAGEADDDGQPAETTEGDDSDEEQSGSDEEDPLLTPRWWAHWRTLESLRRRIRPHDCREREAGRILAVEYQAVLSASSARPP